MEFEGKLTPILREGVDVIKAIFFKKLKPRFQEKFSGRDPLFAGKLAGAVINDLFGTPNPDAPFANFVEENKAILAKEMREIASEFEEMRIPLTDALRIQFLCDGQEGIDSAPVLMRAKELKILLVDREIPLPASFINMARKLGSAFGILLPEMKEEKAPTLN